MEENNIFLIQKHKRKQATIQDLEHYQLNHKKIKSSREK